MQDDKVIQQHVIDELDWEPQIDAAHIGVVVDHGVVTLTGHVGSYAEKLAAADAAARVRGVKAIAQEIEVRLPFDKKLADDQIAERALHMLHWNVAVPEGQLTVSVERGWVTLKGQVDWAYQRTVAEEDVRKLGGVVGVVNLIEVKPQVSPLDVRDKITAALERSAAFEASGVTIDVAGPRVTLGGKVSSWHERRLAENAAWAAPGVREVENRITVS